MGKGYRQNRLGEEIRKLVSEMLLRELKDPELIQGYYRIVYEISEDMLFSVC